MGNMHDSRSQNTFRDGRPDPESARYFTDDRLGMKYLDGKEHRVIRDDRGEPVMLCFSF